MKSKGEVAALAETGGGRVNAVERDSEHGATWEVEVTKLDGSTVDVRLDAGCECASVTYDLVLEEKLPNKQWKAVRETRRVDLRGAVAEERVEHRMAADIELIGYSAKARATAVSSRTP